MNKVSIIGVGLIGGSLGKALRQKGYFVYGLGRHKAKLEKAKQLGAIDAVGTEMPGRSSKERNTRSGASGTDWLKAIADSDIIVIASPVDTIIPVYKSIYKVLKSKAVVTDAGSAKFEIMKEAEKFEREKHIRHFVGAHPLAGSEKSGVEWSDAKMLQNAVCVLIENSKKNIQTAKVKKLWQDAGLRVVMMSASEHDRLVSVTSHLPHVLSFGLCGASGRILRKDGRLKQLIAGSFRDMTRVAGSSPEDWAKISSQNRQELAARIDEFVSYLKWVKKNLSSPQKLKYKWEECKLTRSKIIGK